MFSTGFSSGDLGGKGSSVMLGGTVSLLVVAEPCLMSVPDPKRKSMTLRAHRDKWPTGGNLNRQIRWKKSVPRPIVPVQSRIRDWMPIMLPMSATGSSHLGNLGFLEGAGDGH